MTFIKTSKLLKISRANLQLMKECPRCFWLYKHKDIRRPQGYPYTLSIAVDQLLKHEFDEYREKGEMHPVLLGHNGLSDAKLYPDQAQLQKWRNNFEGLKYHDESLDATLFGAVDDMLKFPDGSLAVIDYKSSGAKEISVYDDYQMQMDTYTYILEQLGLKTARKAYFVFFQVDKTDGFRGRLPFRGEIREVTADPSYIYDIFADAVKLARSDVPPQSHSECQYCLWAENHKHINE
ncbi:MAG: PD-(D/E)XK nuclease family protein [Candidatus Yanofskybacteria bacterium]|nr:PD-(D/E)XK nuclease family protein [Candidatus Yanofskybacteria bacterium]